MNTWFSGCRLQTTRRLLVILCGLIVVASLASTPALAGSLDEPGRSTLPSTPTPDVLRALTTVDLQVGVIPEIYLYESLSFLPRTGYVLNYPSARLSKPGPSSFKHAHLKQVTTDWHRLVEYLVAHTEPASRLQLRDGIQLQKSRDVRNLEKPSLGNRDSRSRTREIRRFDAHLSNRLRGFTRHALLRLERDQQTRRAILYQKRKSYLRFLS